MSGTETLVGVIPKSRREEIQVHLDTWRGHRLCNVRVFLLEFDGVELDEPRATKKGVVLKPDKLPELIRALAKVCELEGVALDLGSEAAA